MKLFNRKNFSKNESGVIAIEFAILLPFLLIVLYGAYTVSINILLSRKVDNAVNDLGFILSREPRIATGNTLSTGGCNSDGCTGGATRLNAIIDNVMPMLLYPQISNSKSAVMVSYVGIPTSLNSTLAPNAIRMMWSHQRGAPGAVDSNVSNQLGLQSMCAPFQSTTTVDGATTPTSTYKEKYSADSSAIERATAIFPGQSFLVASLRFQSDGFGTPVAKGGRIPSGHSLFDSSNFIRHSTYAIRSSWQDVNGNKRVDANEFFNEMHYCTDCSLITSRDMVQPIETLSPTDECTAAGVQKLKMRCVANPATLTPPVGTTPGSPNYYSSGCSFK